MAFVCFLTTKAKKRKKRTKDILETLHLLDYTWMEMPGGNST